MMRLLAILLILGGIGAGFVWPQFVMRNSGREMVRETVFERGSDGPTGGYRAASIDLSPADNPVRIVIEAEFLPGREFQASATPIQVSLSRSGDLVLEGVFDLTLPGKAANQETPRKSGLALPEFDVEESAQYNVTVRPIEETDLDIKSLTISLRSKVEVPDDSLRRPSLVAIGLGVALLIIFGRRRSRPQEPPGRPVPRRWGRGEE